MPIRAPVEDRIVRCAIYTRKSTDRGLDAPVSSLEAQRDVCQAYVKCQAHRNWVELPHQYDDGGYSGGNLERPALQRLISDVEAGRIDIVVIYKIDRLSRSLTDFVRLMDVFDKYGASFVSVTQTFDTSDSMGRLVLNILLTFAQFEREIMSDRVRDKKAAMKAKGLYTGGTPPVGYRRGPGGKLVVDPSWSAIIRELYRRLPDASLGQLARELQARGVVTRKIRAKGGTVRGGQKIWASGLGKIIRNPIYAGYFHHRGALIKARVEALVSREEWDRAQQILLTRFPSIRDPNRNFLLGILHDELGRKMKVFGSGPGRSRTYRYYRTEQAGWARGTGQRNILVESDRVELLAVGAIKAFLVDRVKLKEAVLSLGLYSDEVGRLLRRGQLAARRLELLDKVQLREFFLALVPRAEVTRTGLRLLLSCFELGHFLGWDGVGIFRKSVLRSAPGADRFRLVYAPAALICGHPYFILPIRARPPATGSPDPHLVSLLEQAADLRQYMLTNRSRSIAQLANERKMGASMFARLVRVNYLAPDIQTAILDGVQPAGLTRHKILFGPMPLDWEQQRQLMGFN
jgi:site-specific DNA recombinase